MIFSLDSRTCQPQRHFGGGNKAPASLPLTRLELLLCFYLNYGGLAGNKR